MVCSHGSSSLEGRKPCVIRVLEKRDEAFDGWLLVMVLWAECLCPPPHSYTDMVIPNVTVFGGGAFRGN